LTTYYGAIFNTNKDVLDRGDFRINSSIDNMFVVDSDIDAIGIGGATPNAVWDVNIYGGVQINSSAAGGIYDGLLVQGDTDPALLNVNADRDKVGISTAFPDYTLDVDGDINFTGDLYDNGVLFSGGGSEEYVFNMITNNRIISFPSSLYGCYITDISFVISYNSCSGCYMEYNLGYVSSNVFTNSNTIYTYTPTTTNGQLKVDYTLNQIINSSNDVLEVDYISGVPLNSYHASVIVTCN
jgi:hypothetical protein